MGVRQQGGCLCGGVRYEVAQPPLWVTVCYCRFCQKATGSDHMVEPIFERGDFAVIQGKPRCYTHVSAGSGQEVHVHFCPDCGTKLYLTFARWPDRLGVYAGSFDDPGWFPMTPENTKHIFTGAAARGTLIPAGYNTFSEHSATLAGEAIEPTVLDSVKEIGRHGG